MTRRIAALSLLVLLVGTGAAAAQGSEAAAALQRGAMLERRADYPHAYAAYRQASRLYGVVGDRDGVSRALSAVAHLHVVLGRFPEALAVIDSAFGIQLALNAKLPTDESREGLARTLQQRGEVLAQLGKLDSAAAAFDSASSYFASAKTTGRRQGAAGVLAARGALEGKRLRYQDAIRFYEQARGLYHELGDQNAEAQQLDSIAYYQSRQGGCEKAIAVFEAAYQLHLATSRFDDAGFSQSQIGQCRWRLGNAPRAIAAHTLAIDLRKRAGDRSGVAYSMVQLAGLYRESGDPRRALDTLRSAAAIYRQLGDVVAEADARVRIGALYAELKDVPRALEQYRSALTIQRTIHDVAGRAVTLYRVGAVYFDLARDDSAETYLRSALELQREAVDLPGQIQTLALLGRIAQRYDGNDSSASNYLKNALALAERTGDPTYVASCYVSLAQLFEQRGRYDSALAYRGRAADLYRRTQDAVRLGAALLEIGRLDVTGGDFTAAREVIDSALAAGQRSGNRGLIGNAYRSLADLQSLQGEYRQALAFADSAIRISAEVNNSWAVAAAYTTAGQLYGALAEYGKALGYYQQVDSIYVSLGDSVARFSALNDMGKIHFWQGDYDRALALYQRALTALTRGRISNEDRAIVLSNIGEVQYEQRQYAEALGRLHEALGLADSIRAPRVAAAVRTLLGKVALAQGQSIAARQYLDSALVLRERMNEPDRLAELQGELGRLHYQDGDFKRARRDLKASIAISQRIGSDTYLWEPLFTLALVERDEGNPTESQKLLEQAVDVLEGLADRIVGGEDAQRLFKTGAAQSQVYGTLISLLHGTGQAALAFQYQLRSQSTSRRVQYRSLEIQYQDTATARVVAQLRDLRATADRLAQTVTSRRAAEDTALKNSANTASITTARTVADTEYSMYVREEMAQRQDLRTYLPAVRDFRRQQDNIRPELAIVAYFAAPDSLFIFVTTRTDVLIKVVPIAQDDFNEKVRLLVRAASTPPVAGRDTARTGIARARGAAPRVDFYALSAELYGLLIAPIDSLIGGRQQLAIMPSGELYYLPFQILGRRRADSTFAYLDDAHTIFYLDRLSVDTLTPPRILPRIMAFGNADGTLASAQQEVEEIHAIFPTSRILVRDSATVAQARSVPDQFNVVHFATHGTIDYKHPENSYLTLAPGGGQDGRLRLLDIYGDKTLRYRQLVVLSACNTAVSSGGFPDSPAGGFFEGGVKTVIASLWAVNDVATSRLMADFYRNLATMRRDEALRAAQRALRANPKYAHPYYWSAWVLIGDWR